MSLGLAPFYRRFELPWARTEEAEARFLSVVAAYRGGNERVRQLAAESYALAHAASFGL